MAGSEAPIQMDQGCHRVGEIEPIVEQCRAMSRQKNINILLKSQKLGISQTKPILFKSFSCRRCNAPQEYMNVDNREYVFRVLNDVTKLPFLAEASSEFAINVFFSQKHFPMG